MKSLFFTLAFATILVGTNPITQAADSPTPLASATKAMETKAKQMPFRGKLIAIDKTERSITLQGKERPRVLRVAAACRIQRDGKAIGFDEVQVGESVGGLAKAAEAGQWEVVTLSVGLKASGSGKRAPADESAAEATE